MRPLRITLRQGVLLAMVVVSLYPAWFVIQTALKTNTAYTLSPTGLPTHPTLENLRRVLFDLPLPRWALNSAVVTVASVGVTTFVAMLAAYAIVFSTMKGRDFLLSANLALMVVPPVALLLPMFVLMVNAGLINTLPSVIVFYAGLMLPFSVFFFVNFFRQFPRELIEAATVDGASPFTTLRRIVMPISAVATFTLVIVNAIWVWNELLIALDSDEVETPETVAERIARAQPYANDIVAAPDCGMKYLSREAAFGKLQSLVAGARLASG